MKDHRSKEDYLEAVYMLSAAGEKCRCVDVARKLEFSRPSVTNAIRKLEAEGLVAKGEDGSLSLTEEGLPIGKAVCEKHRFFKELLESLGVEKETAEEDACGLEHSISRESYLALKNFVETARKGER